MCFRMNDEMRQQFMRIIIYVLSRPHELSLKQCTTISAFMKHREILDMHSDPNAVIASVLGGDEYRIACYHEVCAKVIPIVEEYMSIPADDVVEHVVL